ncbi:MAG: hypothetical protein KJ077_22415 [Anaerolineae bacterium]|nr:hypothetical protein [Anaerolineae bacterium]
MAKTIVSLYDDFATAQRVAQDLVDAGFSRDNISVMANDAAGEYGNQMGTGFDAESNASGAATGAGVGATVGGIGGLLVGLGAIAIPGIGPVIAAGPLVTALASAAVGAGVGAVAGGLVGALVDAGVPEEEAEYYAEGVRRGGALLTVQIPDGGNEQQAMLIINRHQPVDIRERASYWGTTGWTGFDPDATPYSASDIAQERTSYRAYRSSSREGTGYGENPDNDPNYGSRGWREVEPGPGEESYRDDPTRDPNYGSRGWTEVEPAPEEDSYRGTRSSNRGNDDESWTEVEPGPGETSYRGDVTDDPNYGSRGWREVEPPAGEPMEPGQPTSRTMSGTQDNTLQGNLGGFVDDRPPVEGRADIDEDVDYAQDQMANTARQGWEEVKDTARDAWQETKEAVGLDYDYDDDDYDTFDARFREHYNTNYANSGYDYDTTYAPAYRFGYDLAYDVDYGDRDWTEIEPEARRYWESSYEGAWDQFKNAIRHAWEETKEAIGLEADEDFKTYDPRFREHYTTNFGNSGYDYGYYIPAYRYGYDLAYASDYDDDRSWDEIEPEARSYWESNREGAWDQFKAAVRHAWEETKEAIGLEDEDDYNMFEPQFRQHYTTTYASSGYDYDTYYAPAYRYGYDLAYYPDYRSRSWAEIEPDVRRNWETSNQGTWDQFKNAIRHAWEETKEAVGLEDDDDDLYDESDGSRRTFQNRSF